MKAVFLFALFSGCLCLMANASVSNFKDMIEKVTMKKSSSYTSYGCHCILSGRGAPVDLTDRCCATHNCCYLRLEQRGCKPKSNSYNYRASSGSVACGGNPNDCGRMACECDKTASLCLNRAKSSYADKNKNKWNFTCKGSKPACACISCTGLGHHP